MVVKKKGKKKKLMREVEGEGGGERRRGVGGGYEQEWLPYLSRYFTLMMMTKVELAELGEARYYIREAGTKDNREQ